MPLSKKTISIGELKVWMESQSLSAEDVARRVPLSNMTIRRLLKKDNAQLIPAKYQGHLARLVLGGVQSNFGHQTVIDDPEALVVTGLGLKTSEEVIEKLIDQSESEAHLDKEGEILEKIEQDHLRLDRFAPQKLLSRLKKLKSLYPQAGRSHKMAILASFSYVLLPADLIVDAMMGIGFIDDLGVLMMVARRFKGQV